MAVSIAPTGREARLKVLLSQYQAAKTQIENDRQVVAGLSIPQGAKDVLLHQLNREEKTLDALVEVITMAKRALTR